MENLSSQQNMNLSFVQRCWRYSATHKTMILFPRPLPTPALQKKVILYEFCYFIQVHTNPSRCSCTIVFMWLGRTDGQPESRGVTHRKHTVSSGKTHLCGVIMRWQQSSFGHTNRLVFVCWFLFHTFCYNEWKQLYPVSTVWHINLLVCW